MTFEECVKQYNVAIYYDNNKNNMIGTGWFWAVECGYQCFDAHSPKETAAEAEAELREWLKTWDGPTK